MKKALSLLLSMLLACGLVLNAGALTLENVETTQETGAKDLSAAALNEEPAVAAMPAEYDESYGQLILFANATDTVVSDYVKATPLGLSETTKSFNGKNGFLTNDAVCGGTYGVGISGGSGAETMTYSAAPEIPVYGTVTLLANVYFDGTPKWGGLWVNTTWGGWNPWLDSSGSAVGTPDGNTWVSTKVLQYSFTESNPLTKYGVCECGTDAPMYCYGVSVYLKPTNAFWMLDANGNRELIVLAEDTYTLPTEYKDASVTKWTDGTQLYDAGTTLAKENLAGKTFEPVNAQAAPVPEAYDPTYGKLLYFNNFVDEPVNDLLDLSVENAGTLTVKNGYYCVPGQNGFFKQWFNGVVSGIELTAGKNADDTYKDWTYTSGEPVNGTLRIVAEVWGTEALTVYDVFYNGLQTYHRAWDAGYTELRTSWNGGETNTDTWITYSPSKASTAQDCFKRWGVGSIGAGNEKLYFRSIAIYASDPDNVFWMVNIFDGTKEYVEMTGDSYTLPTEYKGNAVEIWTDGTTEYQAGSSYAKAELAGKMLSPFFGAAPAPADYHPEYGQLLYYNNFKDASVGNLVDLSVEYAGELSTKGGYYCVPGTNSYYSFGASGLYGIGVYKKDSDGNYTNWTYGDGTTVSGKLRIVAEVYTDEDSGMWDAFVNGKEDYGSGWSGLIRSAWGSQIAVGGTWTTVTPENTYSVGNFQRWGISNANNGKVPYYRSIAIYATAPDNAFWTTDEAGENRKYLVISGDTYTLPTVCGTKKVIAWTDGTTEYQAGTAYAKAELAGKTLTAINGSPAPTMLESNSIRFGTNKGLRFAAVVDLELRKNEQTEEYGFLVTRKELLDAKGVTNDTLKVWIYGDSEVWEDTEKTVGLTENEVVFVAGRAWKNDGSIDLIYDNAGGSKLGEESIQNGTAIGITAILTGITEERYKEVFVVRPYVKISGTYYYGETKENSYYNVAKALRGSASYDALTEEQKAEIDNVIASVEG
ncbi:MAG: hypothetical protein ACI4RV_06950 [Eubacteriales bacterium]